MLLAAHLLAFVPAAVLALFGSRDGRHWMIAAAFALSAIADLVALNLTGTRTWAVYYALSPAQFGLVLWALGRPSLGALLVGLSIGQAVTADFAGPDIVGTVAGSVFVLVVAKDTRMWAPMLVYCGFGTVFYLLMVARIDDYAAFMPWWAAYQASRLTAFGLFGRAAWRRADA
jgi:hypothetical protein